MKFLINLLISNLFLKITLCQGLLPNETYGYISGLNNFYLTAGEITSLNMEAYFRGNFLTYNYDLFKVHPDGDREQVFFPR